MLSPIEIKPGIWWVGGLDWNERLFHGYTTEMGITYNAYLIIDEKITLIDTTKKNFSSALLDRISRLVDPEKIDYVIANHVEMDHSGSLPEVMKVAPHATIVASDPQGLKGLRAHYGDTYNYLGVKSGDVLSIGKRKLNFIQTPMVHWPDNMVTYCPEDKILFSNDSFGQHITTSGRFDTDNDICQIMAQAKKYYANIVQPYAMQAAQALKAVKQLDLDMIAPSHGVIWTQYIDKILEEYERWTANIRTSKAVIIYDSMWGSTAQMARAIMSGFIDANVECHLYDVKQNHPSDIMCEFLDARYVCVGSSTQNSQMLATVAGFLTYMRGLSPRNENRIGLAFGSYGWAPMAQINIENQLKEAKFQMPFPKQTYNWVPSTKYLEDLKMQMVKLIHDVEEA